MCAESRPAPREHGHSGKRSISGAAWVSFRRAAYSSRPITKDISRMMRTVSVMKVKTRSRW